jgi:thioredoxin reductase (NADPH)
MSPDTYDVIIIGAGPAGMQCGTYLVSEGVRTLILERGKANEIGGQIAQTTRVNNVLGFSGKTGTEIRQEMIKNFNVFAEYPHQDLTGDLLPMAEVKSISLGMKDDAAMYNVEVTFHRDVRAVDTTFYAKAVVVASGMSWDAADIIPRLGFIRENDLYFGPAAITKAMTDYDNPFENEDVVVVGGGNSAAQAAVQLAKWAGRVTMLCRSGLKCSAYLVNELAEAGVIIETGEIVRSFDTEEHYVARTGNNIEITFHKIVYAGAAKPNTSFLSTELKDDAGYIICNDGGYGHATAHPGLFAAGDVRQGSIKRCGAALGSGSVVATAVHNYLESSKHPKSCEK